MIQDIGIIDTKKIISSIYEFHAYDFSDYTLTTFKRRILKVANQLNYTNINDFIGNLNDKILFEKIIDEIAIDTTEMFRDPPVWRDMKDIFLPELYKNRDLKIWFPEISSGDEIFSLAIILQEINILDSTKIIVTGMSDRKIDMIKRGGMYDLKKMEISEANFKRINEAGNLSDYYKIINNKSVFDLQLIKGVEFKKHNLISEDPPGSYRIIIYRNRMIYFNQSLQDKITQKLIDGLMPGGLLFIGNKETLESTSAIKHLTLLNPDEKIFKKRIV